MSPFPGEPLFCGRLQPQQRLPSVASELEPTDIRQSHRAGLIAACGEAGQICAMLRRSITLWPWILLPKPSPSRVSWGHCGVILSVGR